MTKTPREILEILTDAKDEALTPLGAFDIDKAIIALDKYYEEIRGSEQYILNRVEIDKAWVKKLLLDSNLLDGELAERIAEGIKIYSPIKLVEKK